MKALAIVNKGIEDIAALEIKEILKTDCKVNDGCAVFDFKERKELDLLCKKARSLKRVLIFLENVKDIKEIKNIDVSKFLTGKTFRVSSEVIDNEIFNLDADVGEIIFEKEKAKVDLEKPDVVFFVYVARKETYFGIDVSGDLSKRDYKIFTSQRALKGNVAYALVRLSGFSKGKVLVDVFSTSEIPIEAALFAKAKIYSISQNINELRASQANAKIAGVFKQVNFLKMDVDWLDTKFRKNSVDCVVSRISEVSKNKNIKDVEQVYDEFFNGLKSILKKNGKIVLMLRNPELLNQRAGKHGFKVKEEREVWCGKEKYKVVVFGK